MPQGNQCRIRSLGEIGSGLHFEKNASATLKRLVWSKETNYKAPAKIQAEMMRPQAKMVLRKKRRGRSWDSKYGESRRIFDQLMGRKGERRDTKTPRFRPGAWGLFVGWECRRMGRLHMPCLWDTEVFSRHWLYESELRGKDAWYVQCNYWTSIPSIGNWLSSGGWAQDAPSSPSDRIHFLSPLCSRPHEVALMDCSQALLLSGFWLPLVLHWMLKLPGYLFWKL